MKLSNLTNYRKAKVVSKDLSEILTITNTALKQFSPYYKYTPVKSVMSSLLENKASISLYLKHYNKVVETKGEINHNETNTTSTKE